jgi:hypothetical protein
MGLTGTAPMLLANLGVMMLTVLVIPFIPRSQANRRLPLYGSRFSPMAGEAVVTRPTHPTALADAP